MIQIYKNLKEEEVFIPYKSSMRLWKFKLQNNKFINLHIPNKNKLIKYLEKYQPQDVWFTNALFLNARHLEDSTYKNRLIKKNLVFDLDDVNINEVRKLLKALKPFKLTLSYVIKTSDKSYQISFIDDYKKEIIDYIIKKGIKIDKKIYDIKRVIRAPLTYHHSGHYIYFINNSLNSENRQESLKSDEIRHHSQKKIRRVGEPAHSTSFYKFITNKVNNNNYIFFARFLKENNKIEEIKELQNKYNLGSLYLMDYGKEIGVLSLKCFNPRRITRIYNNSKCISRYKNSNKKFKKVFIRTSKKIRNNNIELASPRKLMMIRGDNNGYYSKRHLRFLQHLDFNPDLNGFNNSCGDNKLLIYKGEFN